MAIEYAAYDRARTPTTARQGYYIVGRRLTKEREDARAAGEYVRPWSVGEMRCVAVFDEEEARSAARRVPR